MLRRFLDYTDKVFGLSNALSEITDTRSASRIPTLSVLWSSFIMHVTRLGSLNALDVELRLLTGEKEVAAAKRIIERLCDHYTRFFDVVVADAFYMEGPFVNFCVGKGKDMIIVLKDNYPQPDRRCPKAV